MKHKGSKPISDPAKAYSRGRVTVKTPFTLEEIVKKGESYCVNKNRNAGRSGRRSLLFG